MTVVLLGDMELYGAEYEYVERAVEDRGVETVAVDTQQWPSDEPVEYAVTDRQIVIGDSVVPTDVTGVFSMGDSFELPRPEHYSLGDERPRVAVNQLREWRCLLQSLLSVFEHFGATVPITPAKTYWDNLRPWMLSLYEDEGIPLPETTFTSDPDRLRAFVDDHAPVFPSMVNGGPVPDVIRSEDLSEGLLEKLSSAPVKLQEFVPGDDVRGYVLDGELIELIRYEYDSEAFSWKRPEVGADDVGSTIISAPSDVEETVRRAGELTPAEFSAVDCRLAEDGSLTVLESNVPGRFGFHDRAGTTDVGGALADYLVGEATRDQQ